MHRSVAFDLTVVTGAHHHSVRTAQVCSLAGERESRRAALAIALSATHTSGRQLADMLAVSESIARDLRSGRRPLTDARVALFAPRLRAAYEAALREGVQLPLF